MTGGEQDLVAWKPTQAPRQHSVQYRPRKALLRSVPFRILPHISRPPFSSSALLREHARGRLPFRGTQLLGVVRGCRVRYQAAAGMCLHVEHCSSLELGGTP